MEKKTTREIVSDRWKIGGTISSKIGEEDASSFVGSIIEKGMQDKHSAASFVLLPPPQPTVLPFPVARHRSYGPHWGPVASIRSHSFKDDDEDVYDEYDPGLELGDVDSVSSLANLVQRNEKKNLDFSKWREIVNEDTAECRVHNEDYSSGICMKAKDLTKNCTSKQKPSTELTNVNIGHVLYPGSLMNQDHIYHDDAKRDMLRDADNRILEQQEGMIDDMGSLKIQDKIDEGIQSKCRVHARQSMLGNFINHTFPTIEGQIDAENRDRLQKMSPDEIAEAQAEIKEKINPALLKVLQKRGQAKTRQCSFSSSNPGFVSSARELSFPRDRIGDMHGNLPSTTNAPSMVDITSSRSFQTSAESVLADNSSPTNISWNSWTERVEKVGEFRFSFGGDVIGDNAEAQLGTVERDFLRTEGDPGASGYTIKETITLTRSLIPGQRTLALHLLASVFDKALRSISFDQIGLCIQDTTDWEAVWAFILGPEPELVLSLRLCIDDNHSSVVLACAKAITCILGCDLNENYFDISEKVPTCQKDVCIAPVFRCKSDMDNGLFGGGFWKYSAKPSTVTLSRQQLLDDTAKEHTIQDDVVIAGQDIAAGLVRMGLVARIHYMLETDPNPALEEYLISILIAIARHSPTAASSIIDCEQLVQTIFKRFTIKCGTEICPYMIKSVILLKVLAKYNKKNCMKLTQYGSFRDITWQLCQRELSLDQWLMMGKETRKLKSALMVQQLRFWRVCVQYGYCLSVFREFYPSLCLWLNLPPIARFIEMNALYEYACISREAYSVIGDFVRRLPNFYMHSDSIPGPCSENQEECCWSDVIPIIYSGIPWLGFKNDPCISHNIEVKVGFQDQSLCPILWVISAIMNVFSCVLERAVPEDAVDRGLVTFLPWLPEFVTKLGLEILRNNFISFFDKSVAEIMAESNAHSSLVAWLSKLRHESDKETSLASVCCLRGLFKVICSVDKLMQPVSCKNGKLNTQKCSLREQTILSDGILACSQVEFRSLMITLMKLVALEWHHVQSIEMFGRGGPAPGVGLGWGAPVGGFWSLDVLVAQADAALLMELLETLTTVYIKPAAIVEERNFSIEQITSSLQVALMLLPGHNYIMEKVLDFLFQVPLLETLDLCIRKFVRLNKGLDQFESKYTAKDYRTFSKSLSSHYRNRWLSVKKKKLDKNEVLEVCNSSLPTIHEDADFRNSRDQSCCQNSLVVEWAQQRLPLPSYWYLSSITSLVYLQNSALEVTYARTDEDDDSVEISKAGLFFILGIEAMSCFISTSLYSSVQSTPLVWKFHSLSVILLYGFDVLEEEKSRDTYEALQVLYGNLLDEMRYNKLTKFPSFPVNTNKNDVGFLKFQQEISELYPTFVESVVEQFAAISYGVKFFSRQIAIYLHRNVEATVRLCAWNSLSNARVLELLPPLDECIADSQGYLEPAEDNELVLEAYMKSWVSGLLDKASVRRSVTFSLAMHHLASFIFFFCNDGRQLLRHKIARFLLRDFSQKQHHEGMMLELIMYDKPSASAGVVEAEEGLSREERVGRRLKILEGACEGNSSLLAQVGKLKSSA